MGLFVLFSHCHHVLNSTDEQHILTRVQSAKSLALNDVYLIAP